MLKEKPTDDQPKAIVRPYTPTSTPTDRGHLDLVVKVIVRAGEGRGERRGEGGMASV